MTFLYRICADSSPSYAFPKVALYYFLTAEFLIIPLSHLLGHFSSRSLVKALFFQVLSYDSTRQIFLYFLFHFSVHLSSSQNKNKILFPDILTYNSKYDLQLHIDYKINTYTLRLQTNSSYLHTFYVTPYWF